MSIKYKATNTETGETRFIVVSQEELERAVMDGTDECSGPCHCEIEVDGYCPDGWPSRCLVAEMV